MKNKHLKFRPSVAALHNRILKTSEIPLTNCGYILCKNASRVIFLIEMVRIGIEKVRLLFENKFKRMGNMNTGINSLPFADVLQGI